MKPSKSSINNRGSSLIMVLGVIAVVGLMAAATMSIASGLSKESSNARDLVEVDSFTQRLGALLADPDMCSGLATAYSGSPAVLTPIQGLTFYNGALYDKTHFLNSASEQEIRVQSNGATPSFISQGNPVDGMPDVAIQNLFIRNAVPNGTNKVIVQVGHRVTVNGHVFAERIVGDLAMEFSSSVFPGATLVSCGLRQTSQLICENMGCKFNSSLPKVKCMCGFPNMSCTNKTPPRDFIVGVDATVDPPVAVCQSFHVSCLSRPGFVLAGIDVNGNPICQPLAGYNGP